MGFKKEKKRENAEGQRGFNNIKHFLFYIIHLNDVYDVGQLLCIPNQILRRFFLSCKKLNCIENAYHAPTHAQYRHRYDVQCYLYIESTFHNMSPSLLLFFCKVAIQVVFLYLLYGLARQIVAIVSRN